MNIFAEISITNIGLNELLIAIMGYVIVFIALLSLYALFRAFPRIISREFWKNKLIPGNSREKRKEIVISGEEIAAIAMAIHIVLDEIHDEESGVLTIKKTSRAYSPWSSKIYAVRNQFNRL